jgi:anti-sigma regulatory factor (Ser/Thr protein kinase)
MTGRPPRSASRARREFEARRLECSRGFGVPERWEVVWRSHVMKRSATVRLELDSRPESVTLVRAMLSALAESLGLEAELLNDLKTAVSEACNNTVVHAYGGLSGPLVVQVDVDVGGVHVSVRDYGSGIRGLASRDDGMGVGLAVISALASRAEFLTPPDGGGTEVRMWFPLRAPEPTSGRREEVGLADERPAIYSLERRIELSGDVVVTVSPVALMTPVLGRLARALAASARFSFDRFSDVYLVADTIGAHAQRAVSGEQVSFSLISAGKRLELKLGPFTEGSGAQFQRTAAARAQDLPLSMLADEIAVDREGPAETLYVVLRDPGGRSHQATL